MSSTFSFRDYLAYVFPGSILIFGFYLLIYDSQIFQKKVTDNLEIVVPSLIIVTYYAGYLSNVISYNMGICFKYFCYENCNSHCKEDYCDNLNKHKKYGLDGLFIKSLKMLITSKWAIEDFKNESNILYLCWQDIQASDHKGISHLHRIVSLRNFALSSILPFIILGIGLFYNNFVFISITSFAVAFFMILSFRLQSKKFVQSVYRIWYILNKNHEGIINDKQK